MSNVTVTVKPATFRTSYDYAKDSECQCCGRPINYRSAVAVKLLKGAGFHYDARRGATVTDGGEAVFAPIAEHLGREPAEWASAVGSVCAKQLPKTHRTPMKRASALFLKADAAARN